MFHYYVFMCTLPGKAVREMTIECWLGHFTSTHSFIHDRDRRFFLHGTCDINRHMTRFNHQTWLELDYRRLSHFGHFAQRYDHEAGQEISVAMQSGMFFLTVLFLCLFITYTVGHKNVALYFCPYLPKLLSDLLYIPPHHKYISTLPCET